MFKTIFGFFKTGVSLAGVSRWVMIMLLLITFSMGILLSVTMGERDLAQSNLRNAESTLKMKDKTIEEKESKIQARDIEVSGCLGQIQQLNQGIADHALEQLKRDVDRNEKAEQAMATLPRLIAADRELAATPALTNAWLQNLFQ